MKRTKRIQIITILIITTIMLIISFLHEKKDGEVVVGVVMSNVENKYFSRITKSIHDTLMTRDYKIVVIDSQDMPIRSILGVERLIKSGVKVLIFNAVDSVYSKKEIEYAKKHNVEIITIDRKAISADVLSHIGSDDKHGAELAADYIVKKAGNNAKIIELIGFSNTSTTQERTRAFQDKLKSSSDAKIITRIKGDYSREVARSEMYDLLRINPDIDAIFAHNDNMALGAVDALEILGINGVVVVGYDGIPEVIKAIKEGRISATVQQQPIEMGALAADVAINSIQGMPLELHPNHILPVELITQENTDKAW